MCVAPESRMKRPVEALTRGRASPQTGTRLEKFPERPRNKRPKIGVMWARRGAIPRGGLPWATSESPVPEKGLSKRERIDSFEQLCLPHLKSAFNLARLLTRNEHDAEDVLQEAYLRGFIFFEGFNGSNARTWILKVVRNSCYTWLQKNRPVEVGTAFDEELHSDRAQEAPVFGQIGRAHV